MFTLLKCLTALLIVAAILFCLSKSLTSIGINPKDWLFPPPKPAFQWSGSIIDRLKTLQELHTAIASVQVVVSASDARRFLGINMGTSKILYVCLGQVRAGIDLKQLSPKSISRKGSQLQLTLPRPKILDTKIDVEKSYIYDVQTSLVSPDPVYLHDALLKTSIQEITKSSLSTGILEMAQQQAKTMLTSVLGMITEQEVVVVFEEEDVKTEGE